MIHPARVHGLLIVMLLSACASPGVKLTADKHVSQASNTAVAPAQIPPAAIRSFSLPAPKAQPKPETYSVVVSNVKVQDLLFALSRDAKVNIDIHPGLSGNVTLNALDQTLPQLLTRIAKQVDLRFELDGPNLVVMPDTPYLRSYKLDYVNLGRDLNSKTTISSQIGTSSAGIQGNTGTTGNGSATSIESGSKNKLWDSLLRNLADLLRETDKLTVTNQRSCQGNQESGFAGQTTSDTTEQRTPAGAASNAQANTGSQGSNNSRSATVCSTVEYTPAASIMANAETGVIAVRATARQHEKVQEFLDRVTNNAKRQVLIEATVAEVELSQTYQQGIDWTALNFFDTGLRVIQGAAGTLAAPGASLVELGYNSSRGNFTSSIKLLESFGNVRVLSSPKLTVLNNQSALMKVVDDAVYFSVRSETQIRESTSGATTDIVRYTTTAHTIPIGLVMSVTPQIGDDETVTLNVRPSMSRIIGYSQDPNPDLAKVSINNPVPIVRTREFDSVMRVSNGNIVILGGLMEDRLDNQDDTVPGASRIPWLGNLFQNRNDTKKKTELVIFIRPSVIRSASMDSEIAAFRNHIPDETFFKRPLGPKLYELPGDTQ